MKLYELTRSLDDDETGMGYFGDGTVGNLLMEDDSLLFRPLGYGDGWGFYVCADDIREVVESFTDKSGTEYTPFVKGHTCGLKVKLANGKTKFLWLNPSGQDDNDDSTVFVYLDDDEPTGSQPECYIKVND